MGTTARAAISCEGLAVGHRAGSPVLAGVTFAVPQGGCTALVGASGCGKTTLLRTLAGALCPLDGSFHMLGVTFPARPPRGFVGYVPQSLGLVESATTLRNVLLGTTSRLGALRTAFGAFPEVSVRLARESLARVGLSGHERVRVRHLSGGERRRVAIARALAQRPRVLLADEILGELDVGTAEAVVEALSAVQRELHMAVLLVEHDIDVAWEVADRVLGLKGGRVAFEMGTAGAGRERLRELFDVAA